MKSYENSNIRCMLDELERIIIHAEKAVPSVQEGKNERWEQINFEQLTRESESKINVLQRELYTLADIDAMKMSAEDMDKILQRFHKFDVQFLAEINKQLNIEQKKLEKAEKDYNSSYKDNQDDEISIIQYNERNIFIDLFKLGIKIVLGKIKEYDENIIKDAKSRVRYSQQIIVRFERITAEFRTVVRKLSGIHKMLLDKINQATVSNIENQTKEENQEVVPSSNRGRKKEQWWGGEWENHTEQEVEQRLKQAYDATNSLLLDFKGEKNIVIDKSRNAVWAAVYFYAAETEHLVNPGKKANCISFIGNKENPRGLYNIGVNCNRNTVNNYYKIIKGFLRATINLNSNSPNINLFIQKINDEKNTDEYPSTREWLRSNFKNVTNELGDKDNSSEDIVMFVAKNLQILRRIFLKVQPYFKKTS